MTKKHFIALADVLRESKPPVRESNLEYPGVNPHPPLSQESWDWIKLGARAAQWCIVRDAMANYLDTYPRFDRQRWLDYVNRP